MTITAQIIADSVSQYGKRITTLQLRYPRFIHSELMTHRVLSRNASSSRAIPVERLIADVVSDTAMPIHWGKNEPGMQARAEHDAPVVFRHDTVPPEIAWTRARDVAVDAARRFDKAGYHKQIVNRLLEPFAHINVVVTATEWENFFELRDHPDAQPEFAELAGQMRVAMDLSSPRLIREGEWHLPYLRETLADVKRMRDDVSVGPPTEVVACQISAARCARVSYLTHDGKVTTLEEDMRLYARLAAGRPRHASPLEHQATPAMDGDLTANLRGWQSFRTQEELTWSS